MKRNYRRMNRKGFTMIELMVVVVVVGVLATIAVPMYGRYIKNARVTEGTARVGELVTSSKAWAQENQDGSGSPIWPSTAGGIVDLSDSENFSYAITSGGGADASSTALVITATGLANSRMDGVTITVTVPNLNSNGNPPVVAGL